METIKVKPVKANLNESVFHWGLTTTFKVLSESVNGSAAIVEHLLEPKCLGAPMHKHTLEDVISFVIEGTLSVLIEDQLHNVPMGQYIVKPKNVLYTYFNMTDEKIRFMDIIAPGNFENFYAEIAQFYKPGITPDFEKIAELAMRYGLEVEKNGLDDLYEKYGLNKWVM